jgi:hypothetical protein
MSSSPKIIACVLRSGGIYDIPYVNKLANAVARNTTVPYRFVCLTDIIYVRQSQHLFNRNVHETVDLLHGYPGWWSKIELFRDDLFPDHQWLFFDLDTVIISNIDSILNHPHDFTALEDFYRDGNLGSGVLAWRQGDYGHIYSEFVANPVRAMNACPYGDQEWIQNSVGEYDTFQSILPKSMVSFKKHCTRTADDILVPVGASVICFHGTPKPHEVELITIKENWK